MPANLTPPKTAKPPVEPQFTKQDRNSLLQRSDSLFRVSLFVIPEKYREVLLMFLVSLWTFIY